MQIQLSHLIFSTHKQTIVGILGTWYFDPKDETFEFIGNTQCYHYDGGCTLFYSPTHKNRPQIFIGGSRYSEAEKCAEILDYTITNSWERSKYLQRVKLLIAYGL